MNNETRKLSYIRLVGMYVQRTNGEHKNNDNTILIFIGLNKTTQKISMLQEENSTRKDKELCSQTNIF
jgi:hypothetical protein